ncbi:MAG: hypothetical protein J6Y43_04250 [Clostridia bacterium]|nr:hypothetical protein [Clostridia bacterium]
MGINFSGKERCRYPWSGTARRRLTADVRLQAIPFVLDTQINATEKSVAFIWWR